MAGVTSSGSAKIGVLGWIKRHFVLYVVLDVVRNSVVQGSRMTWGYFTVLDDENLISFIRNCHCACRE